ncbi:hypothetical protein [Streptomyces shaanxiensis]
MTYTLASASPAKPARSPPGMLSQTAADCRVAVVSSVRMPVSLAARWSKLTVFAAELTVKDCASR